MSVAAIVPVKALDGAKQRLSAVLDQATRGELVLWLLQRVIGALGASHSVSQFAVVSPDASVLTVAHGMGAVPLAQRGGDLNAGLAIGRDWATGVGADTLLVILGDLPLLRGADIAGLLARAREKGRRGTVVLAPDRTGSGTNAMVVRPPNGLPFAFGPGSLAQHQRLARQRGLPIALYHAAGLAFDLDRAADLWDLYAMDVALPPALRIAEAFVQGSADEPTG